MSSRADEVAETWRQHWEQSDMRPDASLRGRLMRRYVASVGGFSAMRYILGVFDRVVGDLGDKSILDAGSGTGLNSLPLAARGANVTLLDIAQPALDIAKTYYAEQGVAATYVKGSIFSMPFPDESFDVVWNTGVIEHFEPAERRLAVREMLRVMKRDGVMLTVNPNASAAIYRFAKEWAERRGTWDVGFELPIDTLAGDVDEDVYTVDESDEGWFMQLHFLKLLLPRPLRLPYAAAHEIVQNALQFLNRRPGYLKVSVIRRKGSR